MGSKFMGSKLGILIDLGGIIGPSSRLAEWRAAAVAAGRPGRQRAWPWRARAGFGEDHCAGPQGPSGGTKHGAFKLWSRKKVICLELWDDNSEFGPPKKGTYSNLFSISFCGLRHVTLTCSRGTPGYVHEEHALKLLRIDHEIIVSCLQLCPK